MVNNGSRLPVLILAYFNLVVGIIAAKPIKRKRLYQPHLADELFRLPIAATKRGG